MGQGARARGLALAGGVCVFLLSVVALAAPSQGEPTAFLASAVPAPEAPRQSPFVDRVSARGQAARGLYITYPYLRRFKASGVANLVKRSRLDAAVIDLKDDQGRISYTTGVAPLAAQVVASPIDLRAVVAELRAAGVYTIARIVLLQRSFAAEA